MKTTTGSAPGDATYTAAADVIAQTNWPPLENITQPLVLTLSAATTDGRPGWYIQELIAQGDRAVSSSKQMTATGLGTRQKAADRYSLHDESSSALAKAIMEKWSNSDGVASSKDTQDSLHLTQVRQIASTIFERSSSFRGCPVTKGEAAVDYESPLFVFEPPAHDEVQLKIGADLTQRISAMRIAQILADFPLSSLKSGLNGTLICDDNTVISLSLKACDPEMLEATEEEAIDGEQAGGD